MRRARKNPRPWGAPEQPNTTKHYISRGLCWMWRARKGPRPPLLLRKSLTRLNTLSLQSRGLCGEGEREGGKRGRGGEGERGRGREGERERREGERQNSSLTLVLALIVGSRSSSIFLAVTL